ncbi:hypothetical protein ACFVS2_21095 [Brevibacillus sp. NPDC058079]|uniref:hypothetical protein n=1 Tax=Brevibacillus sp. NPDC058079 TaxID=3346330 RepID=UPI0036F10A9D
MNQLSKETMEFLRKYYPQVSVRANKVIIQQPYRMVIPSDLYPLRNKPTMKLFSYMNTKRIENEPWAEKAFNDNDYKMGYCYTNTEKMHKSFIEQGLTDVKTYVGWILIDGIPLHHAWLVYKDIHVLDPAISLIHEIIREKKYEDVHKMREDIVKYHREFQDKPNAFYQTFGQVAPFVLYIGTVCTPDKGRAIYNEMIDQFPNHPSYRAEGMNQNGMSKVQEMFYS